MILGDTKGKNFSTNNLGQRRKSDFYETPYSLTGLLLDNEQLHGSILVPGVGEGAITKVLEQRNYTVTDAYDMLGFVLLVGIKNYQLLAG